MANETVAELRGEALGAASDEGALRAWHTTYLGRKDGRLTGVLRSLGSLLVEERKAVAAAANALVLEAGGWRLEAR